MLNSAEHEIFSAIVGIFIFISRENSFSAMVSKKEIIIVSNLRLISMKFISMKNFMLSWVEHEKSFITSGPDQGLRWMPLMQQFLVKRKYSIAEFYVRD